MQVRALFAGKITQLQPDGERTGIFKDFIESCEINEQGLIDDHQADLRVHGGPEKAVHQYARTSYKQIIKSYPELQDTAVPGSMGENISAAEMDEHNVCIGDIYRVGTVLLQVSQPRNPCWKINHRFSVDGLAKLVHDEQINGWYYRVLESGSISIGDNFILQERPNEIPLYDFLQIKNSHRPSVEEIERLIACEGLAPELELKLKQRHKFLSSL